MKSIINKGKYIARKKIILTGSKFGKLTVLEKCKGSKCKCICDCGKVIYVRNDHLRRGETKSCGCLKHLGNNTKHGKSRIKLYSVFTSIKSRCYNENDQAYKNYGSRGIVVCDEWKDDFEAFYNWAINNGYQENLTIERVNVNGNYEPANCQWVDMKTQQNNKRNNVYLTYDCKTQTIMQWSEELNIPYYVIYQRHRKGWTDKEYLLGKDKTK